MAVERQPIDALNTKVSSYQTKISSFGTLKGLVSTFQTALQGLNTSLQNYAATASDPSIFSATADSTAVAGAYSLNVTNVAHAQNLVAAGRSSSTATIGSGASTTVSFDFGTISGGTLTNGTYSGASFTPNGSGTQSITIDSGNNTLQGIRDAINTANMGVTATIVNDGSGTPYRLALTSNSTGASNSIKITVSGDAAVTSLLAYNPAGTQNLNQTVAAENANLTVNGIAITSASNTVSGAIQGVTLTLSKPTTTAATLTVARDTGAITTAASGFVDAYNALSNQLKSRSAYGNSTTAAGDLAGDGTVRLMLEQLRGILTTATSGGTLTFLSQVGIGYQADGTLKLDSTKLNSAMTTNFSDVVNLFSSTTGFATRLDDWASSAVQAGGLIDRRTTSLNTSINGYNDQISQLEARMTLLQKQYTTTYTNLNMLLISMNSTSAYLTQQFSSSSSK